MAKIAILGFGTVGSGVADVLTHNKDILTKKLGENIEIKYILDLRDFPGHYCEKLVTHDFNDILSDPEVSIVAEMMGGSHPAYDFSKACLEAGKSVVTSNKEVVAKFGAELLEIAKANKVSYLFEASVGGGIPIIRPMCNDLSSNNICSVSGILNGTTNFILTKMDKEGAEFSDVLREAQKLGYAEANPTADVEGIDAARKIVILAALAYGKLASPDNIHTEGITKISKTAVDVAKKLGYSVKLIGHTKTVNGKMLCMVSPRLIPASNPLSGIDGVFNGILVSGDMVGQVMFYGPGAGKLPTASAVCADIVDIAAHGGDKIKLPTFTPASSDDLANFDTYECKRLFIVKNCRDMSCFGKTDKVVYENGYACFITDEMSEAKCNALLGDTSLGIVETIRLL
ncbi:MAG: homoserine dehydrogenase [Ruminococcaceae bacterium]|nr:homoserine dehydrogenase [Oscillospiraceae bacterium]